MSLVVIAAIYAWGISSEYEENTVRALVFVAMVTGNIALVFSNRSLGMSWRSAWSGGNPVLWWIVLGGGAGLAMVFNIPVLRELFHFSGFSGDAPHLLATAVLAAFSVLLLSAGVKRVIGSFL